MTKKEFMGEWTVPASEFTAGQPETFNWSEGVQVPSVTHLAVPYRRLECPPGHGGMVSSSHSTGHQVGLEPWFCSKN